MKLTGEYELTDEGVVIEGKIHDSYIHDVRRLFKPLKEIKMYCGEKERYDDPNEIVASYTVPSHKYRSYIRRVLPDVITPEKDMQFVKIGKDVTARAQASYDDGQLFTQSMGTMYDHGAGRPIMEQRSVFSYNNMKKNKLRLITNSAWVWNAKRDGSFKIELFGLVNRHMMTIVLANATKLAKYIDEVLVKTLDHPEKFTEEEISNNNIIVPRTSGFRSGTLLRF